MTISEFKQKVKKAGIKAWCWCKQHGPGVIFWGGVGVTIGGALRGYTNERKIDELQKRYETTVAVVNNNADCQQYDRERLNELERQTNLLFEKALKKTEGKAE